MDARADSTLEELASEGTQFTNAVSNSPWTLPAHTSMFTGTYTSKHGTHAGYKTYDGQFPTLAELLSANGYQCLGVTNNAWVTDEFGLASGFDHFRKVWQYVQTGADYGKIKLTSHGNAQLRTVLNTLCSRNVVANLANSIYGRFLYRRTDYGAKRTNSIVKNALADRAADEPFFLFVNYLEPHLDYQPPKEYAEQFLPTGATYEAAMAVPQEPWEYVVGNLELTDREMGLLRALYRAEIAYLDDRLGELRSILERAGASEETVFVVVGDHGENLGEFGLMDHQYSLHDTVLNVPLTITGGEFEGGEVREDVVQPLDLFPTLLESAGVPVPEHSQGVSLRPDAGTTGREYAIGEYLHPQPSVNRLSEQTGVSEAELANFDRRIRTVRTETHKFVRYSAGTTRLFDMRSPAGEREDVSDDVPAKARELESTLDAWLESFEHASAEGEAEMTDGTKSRLEDLGYLQ